jgi:hypothetical protein
MPGTFVINTQATFASSFYMACAPRIKYGTTEQDVDASGLPKWEASVAVTFTAERGMRPVSEVIRVVIPATTDPAKDLPPGSPVDFADLRVGVSAAEAKEGGRGVRGGTAYYQSSGLRPAMNGHRPAKQEG